MNRLTSGRTEITAACVARIERLLLFGFKPAAIARRLEISRYVVRVIAGDKHRPACAPPDRPKNRRVPNSCRWVDPATIRMVRRMLVVGILPPGEIAREARVSETTVTAIAHGQPSVGERHPPPLEDGERYLREGKRCPHCGAMVAVIPCRACALKKDFASTLGFFCLDGGHRC